MKKSAEKKEKKPKKLRTRILDLRPTQFAVGMLEVDEKLALAREYGRKERKAFVTDNPVPVVRAPDGSLYVVDKHHFLSVCYYLGLKKVDVEIVNDLRESKMSYAQFWKWMHKNRSCYPFCQFGEGPRNEFYLPKDIRGLADDPYRSLAWYVRKSGGFENSDKNFAEFQWANFFRSRKLLDREGMAGFGQALQEAVKLAQSRAAKDLPGYGKLNLTEVRAVKAKARKRVKAVEALL